MPPVLKVGQVGAVPEGRQVTLQVFPANLKRVPVPTERCPSPLHPTFFWGASPTAPGAQLRKKRGKMSKEPGAGLQVGTA